MEVRNIAAPGTSWADSGNQATTVTVCRGETTLSQLAARLGVAVEDLRQANPQLGTATQISAGMEINLPGQRTAGTPGNSGTGAPAADDPPPPSSRRAESRMQASIMRAMINSPAGRYGATGGMSNVTSYSAAAGPVTDPTADAADAAGGSGNGTGADAVDPRFSAVNQALQAGDGAGAMAAAQKLVATLQAEKPPQPGLLNQARMSLAAASMLNGDLDSAGKALLSINPKKLDEGDQEHYTELRDLLKDARREAFSTAFEKDTDPGADVKDRGKTAAAEAAKLVDFLQKAEPGNTQEIAEAKLKQANALLLGNNYRQADKVLSGINPKVLEPEQQEYLGAMRDELHAQQTDALALGYDSDMRHKRYKDAVSDSSALVNDLARYFPDDKGRLVKGRLQQATAQIMNGDMEDAGKTLGRISRNDLQQMPKEVQQRFGQLTGAVQQHFENVKRMEALKAEQAAVETQLKNITTLSNSGNKASAQQAVGLAEQLLSTMQQKHPDDAMAIAGVQITLANARVAAGDMAGAKADLQGIAATNNDPQVQGEVQLLQARIDLKEGHPTKAVKNLEALSQSGATPELRKAAKDVVISVETGYLKQVDRKTQFEQERLEAIRIEKTPDSAWSLLNPLTAVKFISHKYDNILDEHQRNLNHLGVLGTGAVMIGAAMKSNGLTLAELSGMSIDQIAKLKGIGPQNAAAIAQALTLSDVKTIAKDDFEGKHFSWDNNSFYVDASYLDTEMDKVAQWVGKQVRGARNYDEELKSSDSIFERAVGYTSGAILDAVSASNNFIKEKIHNANEFYNDPERKDAWFSKLGRAGTWGADMLSSVFTMPATIADYKATDDERKGAIIGTAVMVGTMGVIKAGGPAWKSLGGMASRGSGMVAESRLGQWVARSEFGQLAGRTATKVANVATKIEDRFEATSFAKGMDRIKSGLGKLNPTIGGAKLAPTKTVDQFVDEILDQQTPEQLRASVTAEQIASKRAEFADIGQDSSIYTDDQIRKMVAGDRIYKRNYNPATEPKPATVSQQDYQASLQRYDGPSTTDGAWHRRYNKPAPGERSALEEQPAWFSGDVRRFYFNVKPDQAADLADYVANQLNAQGLKFQYKMISKVSKFDRTDAGVLYVPQSEYAAAKKLVQDYAKKHPEAFAEGSPAFTKPIGRGISAADEPVQANLPPTPGGQHSFGSARADITAEAILEAPANASKDEIKQLVRDRLRQYGFDPDKPWLKQNARVDDL